MSDSPVTDALHVFPIDDVIAHEDTPDCACLPVTEAILRDDGTYGWVVVHNAWDGRP